MKILTSKVTFSTKWCVVVNAKVTKTARQERTEADCYTLWQYHCALDKFYSFTFRMLCFAIIIHGLVKWKSDNSGGGGFFFVRKDFGRMFNNSFSTCAFFFLKWRLAWAHLFHSLARISLQWLSMLRWLWPSVFWWVACELFPEWFPCYAWIVA